MSKKLLLTLTVIACVLCCVLGLVACNNDDDSIPDGLRERQISQTQWENTISDKYCRIYNTDPDIGGQFNMRWFNNLYTVNEFSDVMYQKTSDNSGTSYTKIQYNKYEEGERYIKTPVSEDEYYASHIDAYQQVLTFIKNNYDKFEFVHDDKKGNSNAMAYGKYRYVLSGNEQDLDKASEINLKEIQVENMSVYGENELRGYLHFDNKCYTIYFTTSPFDYTVYNAFETLTNYTIVGGPSTTDADYAEIEIAQNGFHVHYPNRGTTPYDKEFYFEKVGDEYAQYRPDSSYAWTRSPATESTYNTTLDGITLLYLGLISEKASDFNVVDGKLVSKNEISREQGKYVYTYSNIVIELNDDGTLSSMTWNLKYEDRALHLESLVYNMTLSTGTPNVEMPTDYTESNA